MLLIDHVIRPSPIHGVGVFAVEPAKKGDVVWRYHPVIDVMIPEELMVGLPPHVIRAIKSRAEHQPDRDVYVLALDGEAYTNHSDDPTMIAEGKEGRATRDISVGDELTWDYHRFDYADERPVRRTPEGQVTAP
jgi:SET domain-containing protein